MQWKDGSSVERTYSFNKLIYLALDVASCPRWFMPLAPFSDPQPTANAGRKSFNDVLCGRQIAHFNEAICGYYRRHCDSPVVCPPSDGEVARRRLAEKPGTLCVDLTQNCLSWARQGECQSNPGFMATECSQSCGWCSELGMRPYLGDPTTTCFDEEPAVTCGTLAAVGACHSQLSYMHERCRKTCEFCNASADAYRQNDNKGAIDTAQHQCPDGSDLGGGETLVDSKGAEVNAKAALVDDDETESDKSAAEQSAVDAAKRMAMEARALATESATKDAAEAPQVVLERHEPQRPRASGVVQSHSAALDVSLASWPFMLVQWMVLLLAGYMLRGFLDRRTKKRRGAQRPPGWSV